MTKKRVLTIAIAGSILGACQTTSFMPDASYKDVERQSVTVQAARVFIHDKKDERTMLVYPLDRNEIGTVLWYNPGASLHRQAARRYFAQNGRSCRLKDGSILVQDAVYELSYYCA